MSIHRAAASALEGNAREIAALACADLLATHVDIDKRFGKEADERGTGLR